MKVLHIINSLSFGGIESGTIRLATEQSKKEDYSVTILCVGRDFGCRIRELPCNVAIRHIPIKYNFLLKSFSFIGVFGFSIKFFSFLTKNKFDVIHSHLNLANLLIIFLARLWPVKSRLISNAYTTHNIVKGIYIGRIFRSLSQYICRRYSDVCAADSSGSWTYCYGDKPTNCKVVMPMPISLARNLKHSIPKGSAPRNSSLKFGNVGRHIPQKNQSFLVDLLKESKNRGFDWRLIIVGSGDLRQDLVQKIASFDLDSRIEIREPVNNLDSFYNEIDIFILPSLSESLPVTLLEAQSFGVRCITSSMVSKDASLIPFLVDFVDLDGGLDIWIDSILRCARINYSDDAIAELLLDSGLDTIQVCQRWDTLYNV